MSRPDFISDSDIQRWKESLENDPYFPKNLLNSSLIQEVCFAGSYLGEQLTLLNCPLDMKVKIIFTAGKLSFGRDIWTVHLQMLEDYKNNTLVFEPNQSSN